MSARQNKYIDQLLKRNHGRVIDLYRETRAKDMAGQWARDYDALAAKRALNDARDRVLLEMAERDNLAYVEWDHEEEAYDFGDIDEKSEKRLRAKLDSGEATVECMAVYARDQEGEWDVVESLGSCWIEGDKDRDQAVSDYLDMGPIKAALYRHRDTNFGKFEKIYVPGHWSVK